MKKIVDNLKYRLNLDNSDDNYQIFEKKYPQLNSMQARLKAYGGVDQWTRMREDKLRGLKKALLSSYQRAIVQKYDVYNNTLAENIISIITLLQDKQELSETQLSLLAKLEEEYPFITTDKYSVLYINSLKNIVDSLVEEEPYFACLINHDKLKVDYQDKIISIPFEEPPINGGTDPVETNFHNGTVFKWVHGNREEWTPDTYWIVYMQYSEETAYFRAEIRKADEQIQIIAVDDQGNETSTKYRGWMTGPNETTVLWNVKKGVVWNDLNYTKLLYITKDENTLAFFQRFDRVIINGQPWQVQAYNENYSTSKTGGVDSGIIRVALKQTYTNTDDFVKNRIEQIDAEAQKEAPQSPDREIFGPTTAYPFDVLTFSTNYYDGEMEWSISNPSLARIINENKKDKDIQVEIITTRSNKEGFYINYGESENTQKHVIIKSL